jgi:hypothetical protein
VQPVGAGLADPWGGLPWAQLPVVLRSRRLPHVTLSGDLLRVGTYEPLRLQEAGLPLPLTTTGLPGLGLGSGTQQQQQPGDGGGEAPGNSSRQAGNGHAAAAAPLYTLGQANFAAGGDGDDDEGEENEDSLLLSAPPPVMYPSPGFGYDLGAGVSPMPPAALVSSPSRAGFGQEAPYGASGFRVGGDAAAAAGGPGRLLAGLDAAALSPPRRPGSAMELRRHVQQPAGLSGLGEGASRSAAGKV